MSAEDTHEDCGHTVCELYQVLSEIYVSTTAHLEAKRYRDEILREAAKKIRSEAAEMDGWPEEQHVARKYADLIDPDKP